MMIPRLLPERRISDSLLQGKTGEMLSKMPKNKKDCLENANT
jgi:hypothetical protein